MFKSAERVQRLLLTLYKSLPSLWNVSLLVFLLFYTFAVLGMSLFSHVQRPPGGAIDHHTNFDSFGSAMLTLCRISTGEGWPDVLQGVVSGLVDEDPFARITAPLYFIFFIIMSDFLFFNLLATIGAQMLHYASQPLREFQSNRAKLCPLPR
eukprot:SAG11_NODE_2801_length_2956_cov_1.470774_5_plen_151_part_01